MRIEKAKNIGCLVSLFLPIIDRSLVKPKKEENTQKLLKEKLVNYTKVEYFRKNIKEKYLKLSWVLASTLKKVERS